VFCSKAEEIMQSLFPHNTANPDHLSTSLWTSGKSPVDPRETPQDDPRQKTDWPASKQTDEPWKGNPENEQFDPDRPDIDLEKWQESNTH
jgi:hypothetical protein